MKTIIFIFLTSLGLSSNARQVIESRTFENWSVEYTQNDWGDRKEIVLLSVDKVSISINPKYNWRHIYFNIPRVDDTWPSCEMSGLAYRIDKGEVVETRMGGKSARGGACATIRLTDSMLKDMKAGSFMEVRAGHLEKTKGFSLIGFSQAWKYAQSFMGQ